VQAWYSCEAFSSTTCKQTTSNKNKWNSDNVFGCHIYFFTAIRTTLHISRMQIGWYIKISGILKQADREMVTEVLKSVFPSSSAVYQLTHCNIQNNSNNLLSNGLDNRGTEVQILQWQVLSFPRPYLDWFQDPPSFSSNAHVISDSGSIIIQFS